MLCTQKELNTRVSKCTYIYPSKHQQNRTVGVSFLLHVQLKQSKPHLSQNIRYLKGMATLKTCDLKSKPLLNHALCHKPDQNPIISKKVIAI